jgi:hypothetical protein
MVVIFCEGGDLGPDLEVDRGLEVGLEADQSLEVDLEVDQRHLASLIKKKK